MTNSKRLAAVLALFLAAAAGFSEVVVLKGGAVVQLKKPLVRQGANVLLTRADGTLLSVPASEIDREATAAARSAPAAPPAPVLRQAATPAEAARNSREAPKARVRITDADVSHGEAAESAASEGGTAADAEKEKESGAGAGRVEIADYTQEKSGDALIVRGTLRNPGATPAINVRMTVTALDSKGQTIASGEAGVSNGVVDPLLTVAFSVTLPVGSRPVASLRFSPRWFGPALPAAAPSEEGGAVRDRTAPAAPPPVAAPPPPEPTPYGRYLLWAPGPPSAPSEPPKDGKTGYLPGASHPSNQPKPPS